MMLETSEGEIKLADSLMVAIARNAEVTADLIVEELKQMFPEEPPENIRLPANYLLELGAVLMIGYWEFNGILAHIEAGLPSEAEATKNLSERAQKGASEFAGDNATPIQNQVQQFWIHNLAWDGPSLMSTEMVLDEIDEDQFMDLAEFLWKHRQELKQMLVEKENTDGEERSS
ncbi:hypothetical protein CA11_53070 [Gimesia maris]|uniref:hypothetical protein n=1 Tax=Gimesia maris TaxID=122 RepID=UPI00118837BE|nr:hypothetical protein [Gimesia maris]QDU17465.1 hypothetical protein CA11_53070 [Gimesia maris]